MLLDFPYRKNIRLQNYDYSQHGAYFVTICVQGRECLFGNIVDGRMVLNDYGKVVQEEWLKTSVVRKNVSLGEYIIMPNHIHGIIILCPSDSPNLRATPHRRASHRLAPTKSGSIGVIIGQFKSIVSKRIRAFNNSYEINLWQRGYYEHVIRNEDDYERIAEYIILNPKNWDMDEENQNGKIS